MRGAEDWCEEELNRLREKYMYRIADDGSMTALDEDIYNMIDSNWYMERYLPLHAKLYTGGPIYNYF